ncbi:MAG: hypothetical protein HC922_08790 [Leptolyngbyaceae cyanobacterium SM2_3_12]|nr:hypothetical protein [Leptolyngbyaceae cyanobacterium SM2_3_12]
MSHRLQPQTSSHPGVSEPSSLPHDRPSGGVILLLNGVGMVESVQTFGSEPGSSGAADPSGPAPEFPGFNSGILDQSSLDWVGQLLSELVTFSDPGAFAQTLTLLTPHSQPPQLQGQCQFQGQLMDMIWVVQPLIGPGGTVVCRTAVGYWLGAKDLLEEDAALLVEPSPQPQSFSRPQTPTLCTQLQAYSPRLNQITRNVRWTLDLETIRRQTVDGLGELFGVSRCLVCSYSDEHSDELKAVIVEAEYRQGADLPVWQGQPLPPAQADYLERAVQASGAVLAIAPPFDPPGGGTR